MIVGMMATFPARKARMLDTVQALAGQLDRLVVVLNEYDAPLPELARFANVQQIVPPSDLKDTAKFLSEPWAGAEIVFLVDDDIRYPPDYVEKTAQALRAAPKGYVVGYHGSTYRLPSLTLSRENPTSILNFRIRRVAQFRRTFWFTYGLERSLEVDQLGTGTVALRAEDMPGFEDMSSAARFVDVRFARLCHQRGKRLLCLARPENWLLPAEAPEDSSIYEDFTKQNPRHVAREIWSYAYRSLGRLSAARKLKRL